MYEETAMHCCAEHVSTCLYNCISYVHWYAGVCLVCYLIWIRSGLNNMYTHACLHTFQRLCTCYISHLCVCHEKLKENQTCMHASSHVCHTYMYWHMLCVCVCLPWRAGVRSTHACMHIYVCIHIHTCIHTHIHTYHTHTYIHTYITHATVPY